MDLLEELYRDREHNNRGIILNTTRNLLYRFEYDESRVDLENSLSGSQQITSLLSSAIDEDLANIKNGNYGNKRQLLKDARELFSDHLHSSIVANSKPLKRKFTILFIELSELLDIQFESPKPTAGRGNPNFKANRLTNEQMRVIVNVANELIEKRPDLTPQLNKKNEYVISSRLYNEVAVKLQEFEPKRIRRNLLQRASFNGTYFVLYTKISLLFDL